MFICSDCNKKYEIKPDYCDCGNNTFAEEISANKKAAVVANKKTFFEQYPEIKKFVDSIDILSGIIFVFCLILSILAWNLIGSGELSSEMPSEPVQNTTSTMQDQNIPDIENLWDNTPPKPLAAKLEAPILPQQSQPEQDVEEDTKPLPIAKPTTKPIAQPLPKVLVQKPLPVKPKPHNTLLNQGLSSLSPEMRSYTNGLSQALFSQWAVGSISGNGLCEVEFSISDSGKLINRRFSKQSDNDSLNRATYGMLMSTPQYLPPPDDYKGEKIRLSFYFNKGSYEVGYPKY